MALTGGIPKLVLLVEFRGDTQEEALAQAEKLASEIRVAGWSNLRASFDRLTHTL